MQPYGVLNELCTILNEFNFFSIKLQGILTILFETTYLKLLLISQCKINNLRKSSDDEVFSSNRDYLKMAKENLINKFDFHNLSKES